MSGNIMKSRAIAITLVTTLFAIVLLLPGVVSAHCDSLDGPVIKAARNALDTGNVNLVLIWVQKKDEEEIKAAFQKALAVRKLSPEAKGLADMSFFETLVRIHRAGEGAPYTGIKPAGEHEPAVEMTDKTLLDGSVEPLLKLEMDAVQDGVREGFEEVISKKNYNPDDVEAGRAYVGAYVEFVHYADRIYKAAKNPAEGHYIEAASPEEAVKLEEAKIISAQSQVSEQEVTILNQEIEQLKGKQTVAWSVAGILALVVVVLAFCIIKLKKKITAAHT